jgi:hypothetical protein
MSGLRVPSARWVLAIGRGLQQRQLERQRCSGSRHYGSMQNLADLGRRLALAMHTKWPRSLCENQPVFERRDTSNKPSTDHVVQELAG